MRKYGTVLIVLAILAVPCVALAEGSSLTMGLGYQHFDQKYNSTPYSGTSGWMPQIYLAYEYKKKSKIYGRLYGDYVGGKIENKYGATVTDRTQRLMKYEGNIGYTFGPMDKLLITPYIGIGYRSWEAGSVATPVGLFTKEVISWFYIPIGVKADYRFNEKWTIGGVITANPTFGSTYWSEMSDSLDRSLKDRVGYSVELPITYRFTDTLSVIATPWYERTNLGGSDSYALMNSNGTVTNTSGVPSSWIRQYGLKLGLIYTF